MDTQTQSKASTGYEANEEMTDLAVQFNKNVRPLLDVVHKLRSLEDYSRRWRSIQWEDIFVGIFDWHQLASGEGRR